MGAVSCDWSDAIEGFLLNLRAGGKSAATMRARREQMQHIARRVEVGPWAVTDSVLLAYVGAQDWKRETRRGRYSAFREFWKWAKTTGHVKKNPARKLPKVRAQEPNPDPVPLAVYEVAMRKSDERTALMLRLAHDAGLRRGEIALVHSEDLIQDFLGWSLRVHGKGGKQRVVPLTPRLALELRALGEGYAFPGAIDGHLSPRRVSELAVDVLPAPWTIHKLRHSFGTNTHEATGGDTLTVQKLLGHASPATTARYVLIPDSKGRAAVYAAAGVNPALTAEPRRRLQAI